MTINDRLTQLWGLLADTAHAQKVLTYDILGQMLGLPEQAIGCFLRPIQDYCKFHNLPQLTALAINEIDEAEAGDDNFRADNFGERAQVYLFDWLSVKSPKPEDLLKVSSKGTHEMSLYNRWYASLGL